MDKNDFYAFVGLANEPGKRLKALQEETEKLANLKREMIRDIIRKILYIVRFMLIGFVAGLAIVLNGTDLSKTIMLINAASYQVYYWNTELEGEEYEDY